jgi:16S rRNA (cytosine1402-N4)-methyltransferase
MADPAQGHDAVLIEEVLHLLDPRPGEAVIDCTLGRGGHACAIGQRLGSDGLLIGLDADPRNLEFAADRLKAAAHCRTRLFHANFAELPEVMAQVGITKVNGILADLGVSTNQLFDPRYGLSFERPGPLDMRLDPRTERTAADLVNSLPERELANVLYELAQERHSRAIARKIGEARRVSPILTTDRLAEIVRSCARGNRGPIDPATRTFLALRMAVNDEVANLAALLDYGPKLLASAGRMAVISFQSAEDGAVKRAFTELREGGTVQWLVKKPVSPAADEVDRNPRSRSARLRAIRKV